MGIESSQLISAPAKNIYNCYKTEKKIRHDKLELSGKSVDHLTLETYMIQEMVASDTVWVYQKKLYFITKFSVGLLKKI